MNDMRGILDGKLADIPVPDGLHAVCIAAAGGMRRMRIRRAAAAVAAIICACVLPVMASGLYGYYMEVKDGTAVTGGVIVNADNDFKLSAHIGNDGRQMLAVEIVNSEEISYRYIECLRMDEIMITDASGNQVYTAENVGIDAEVMETAFDAELAPGEYTVTVTGMTGLFKADSPLPIQGVWECPLIIK